MSEVFLLFCGLLSVVAFAGHRLPFVGERYRVACIPPFIFITLIGKSYD